MRLYKAAMEGCGGLAAAYTTFRRLWMTLLPSVVMNPMLDLCCTCQQQSAGLLKATSLDVAKSDVLPVNKQKD